MASIIHYKFKNELESSKYSFDGARMLYETLKRELFLLHFGRDTETDIDLIDQHSGQVYGPGEHIYKNSHIVIKARPLKPGQMPVFEDPAKREARRPKPTYVCPRCNAQGEHYRKFCPTIDDPAYDRNERLKLPIGIPSSELVEVDADTEGAMVTPDGRFVVRKDKTNIQKRGRIKVEVPPELQCPLCKGLVNLALRMPCCKGVACSDCLLDKAGMTNVCPMCKKEFNWGKVKEDEEVRKRATQARQGTTSKANSPRSSDQDTGSRSSSRSESRTRSPGTTAEQPRPQQQVQQQQQQQQQQRAPGGIPPGPPNMMMTMMPQPHQQPPQLQQPGAMMMPMGNSGGMPPQMMGGPAMGMHQPFLAGPHMGPRMMFPQGPAATRPPMGPQHPQQYAMMRAPGPAHARPVGMPSHHHGRPGPLAQHGGPVPPTNGILSKPPGHPQRLTRSPHREDEDEGPRRSRRSRHHRSRSRSRSRSPVRDRNGDEERRSHRSRSRSRSRSSRRHRRDRHRSHRRHEDEGDEHEREHRRRHRSRDAARSRSSDQRRERQRREEDGTRAEDSNVEGDEGRERERRHRRHHKRHHHRSDDKDEKRHRHHRRHRDERSHRRRRHREDEERRAHRRERREDYCAEHAESAAARQEPLRSSDQRVSVN